MEKSLESNLIECLDALEMGEPIEQILARYPDNASQLRPMLEMSTRLSQLNVQPTLAAKAQSRNSFLATAAALKDQESKRPSSWLNWRQVLMPIASLALVLLILAAGLGSLAASALPDDPLYGTKIFIENSRLSISTDPAIQASLRELFHQRRIQEIHTLLAEKREAEVSFEGVLETFQSDTWIIAGISTQITPETQVIGGEPVIGQTALVNGRTQNGSLFAKTVTLSPLVTPPTVKPTLTPTATPTTSLQAENEPETPPTETPTPTASVTSEPGPTATPTTMETATPPPLLSATPTPDEDGGNDNDNDNDDSNDNDNDDSNDNDDDDSNDNDDDNDNDDSNDNDDDNDNDDSNDNDDDDSNDNDDDDSNDNDDDNDNKNENDDDE